MIIHALPEAKIEIRRTRKPRITPVYRFPSVSVFLPFNPNINPKNKLILSLSHVSRRMEQELKIKYPGEMSQIVIQKFKSIMLRLNFNTHKKSIAIFLSPVFEKIYYLNFDLEEKVIVGESLQITDLVFSKKPSQKFHLLVLGERESRIYSEDSSSFLRISANGFLPEKTFFVDSNSNSGKYLKRVCNSLNKISCSNWVPVFVLGAEKILGAFKSICENNKAIIEYIPGDFDGFPAVDLRAFVRRRASDWQQIREKRLSQKLRQAVTNNKLIEGYDKVQHELMAGSGQVLLMERQLLNRHLSDDTFKERMKNRYSRFSCIKNSTDEMIEKILECGGDLELVSDGFLKEYGKIALIINTIK